MDLPEDPNLKGFAGSKPAFVVTPRACDSPFRTSSDKGDPAAPTSEAGARPEANLHPNRAGSSPTWRPAGAHRPRARVQRPGGLRAGGGGAYPWTWG